MKRFKHFLVTACDILVLLGVAGLILPPSTYGKNKPPQIEKDDSPGQGDEHRADPCEHLPDPPGKAKGHDKKCPPSLGSSSGIAKGDFNGDGFADLAVGVQLKNTPSTVENSGAVIVIYGSANGLVPAGGSGIPASQFWSQNTQGVPDSSEEGDLFGSALAAGHFNGDGYSDLAIGAPRDAVATGVANRGQVTVIYGSANGLTTDPNAGVPAPRRFVLTDLNTSEQLFLFSADVEADVPSGGEFFGSSLAWGDFNGDGVGDLAVGAPRARLQGSGLDVSISGGAVGILYGTQDDGLSSASSQVWTQDSPDVEDQAEDGDDFGHALTAGDFNGDNRTDLAIGVPNEDIADVRNVGAVEVLFGGPNPGRLRALNDRFLTLNRFFAENPAFPGTPNTDDKFGSVLAAGNFDGDERDDLAIGVPFKDVRFSVNAGAVLIQYSTGGALTGSSQFWDQNAIFGEEVNPFFGSTTEAEDRFGAALAAGDFNADARDDLAIGVPFENVLVDRGDFFENVTDTGEVDIIYGSASGLSITGRTPQSFHQSTINIEDAAEQDDRFGFSLTAWNFGRNETRVLPPDNFTVVIETADLAVGVPLENIGTVSNAGAVNVLYGSFAVANGLTSAGDQFFHSGRTDIPGENVTDDQFGSALY